jgi:hypothetical protein
MARAASRCVRGEKPADQPAWSGLSGLGAAIRDVRDSKVGRLVAARLGEQRHTDGVVALPKTRHRPIRTEP